MALEMGSTIVIEPAIFGAMRESLGQEPTNGLKVMAAVCTNEELRIVGKSGFSALMREAACFPIGLNGEMGRGIANYTGGYPGTMALVFDLMVKRCVAFSDPSRADSRVPWYINDPSTMELVQDLIFENTLSYRAIDAHLVRPSVLGLATGYAEYAKKGEHKGQEESEREVMEFLNVAGRLKYVASYGRTSAVITVMMLAELRKTGGLWHSLYYQPGRKDEFELDMANNFGDAVKT